MSQPKIFIPELPMLRLTSVHYKTMVTEQNVAICQRNLQDAQAKAAEMRAKHNAVVTSIGDELGVKLIGWDEATGEANYELLLVEAAPAPPMPEPVVVPAPEAPPEPSEPVLEAPIEAYYPVPSEEEPLL